MNDAKRPIAASPDRIAKPRAGPRECGVQRTVHTRASTRSTAENTIKPIASLHDFPLTMTLTQPIAVHSANSAVMTLKTIVKMRRPVLMRQP